MLCKPFFEHPLFWQKELTSSRQIIRNRSDILLLNCSIESIQSIDARCINFEKFENLKSRFWKITSLLFVDVALWAASILKNHACYNYWIFFTLQNSIICLLLNIRSMLEVLVLKNGAEYTSQRLKWTSGAQVMIIFHAWFVSDRAHVPWPSESLACEMTSTLPPPRGKKIT